MWQDLTAAVLVLLAFTWVLWTLLLPARLRDRLRRLAGQAPPPDAGACGHCAGCAGHKATGRSHAVH